MYEEFLREKRYLLNVSERTLTWYEQALRWLPHPHPDQQQLKEIVVRMRERGLKPQSINSYRTAINSYLHWATGTDRACSPQCDHPRIARLKEPQTIPQTYSTEDIKKLVSWRPKSHCERRLLTLIAMLADTGCRVDELLSLRWSDVSFDDLLICVRGKGDKQRRIPFSLEARRLLFRHQQQSKFDLIFASTTGVKLGRRNVLRDVRLLCQKLNVHLPVRALHAFRHTFALHYLRKGGSVFHLQRALGHTTLEMTRRYANLMTEDLQAVHQKVSLLSAAG